MGLSGLRPSPKNMLCVSIYSMNNFFCLEFYCKCCEIGFDHQSKYERHVSSDMHQMMSEIACDDLSPCDGASQPSDNPHLIQAMQIILSLLEVLRN